MADRRGESGEVAAVPTAGDATHPAGNAAHGDDFVELPVEDVYAALDARKPRPSAAGGTGSFDHMLRSAVTAATRRRRQSAREPIVDADPSGQYDAVIDQSDDPQADPVRRLDAAIAALSAASDAAPGEPTLSQSDWQSAGDCRAYDVLEPGGEPQWDQPADVIPAQGSTANAGIPAPRSVDRSERQHNGHAASAHHPVRRPYARLFSRARQQPS